MVENIGISFLANSFCEYQSNNQGILNSDKAAGVVQLKCFKEITALKFILSPISPTTTTQAATILPHPDCASEKIALPRWIHNLSASYPAIAFHP
jgi:hypothetical protein